MASRATASDSAVRCLAVAALTLTALFATPVRADARWEWVKHEFKQNVDVSGTAKDCDWGGGGQQVDMAKGGLKNVDIQSPDGGDKMDSSDKFEVQVYGVAEVIDGDDHDIAVSAIGRLKDRDKCADAGSSRWHGSIEVDVTYEQVEWVQGPAPAGQVPPVACGNYSTRVRNLQAVSVNCVDARALVRQYLTVAKTLGVHKVGAYVCFDRAFPRSHAVSCQAPGRSVYFQAANNTVQPPGRPCGMFHSAIRGHPVVVPTVRTSGTTCFSARGLARRYLGVINRPGLRKLAPYTCFDRVAPGGWRLVGCKAPTRRYVWFNILVIPSATL